MGVALTELLLMKETKVEFFRNKVLVVDAPMWLYQFLSNIRQRDGALLMDSKGRVTSHLMGLFTRISNLLEMNMKLAFVFDGQPHALKNMTLEKRKLMKEAAQKSYDAAKEKSDYEGMKRFASRTSRLTPEMIDEAKKLIEAFGIPVIQAPSEAEAQASFIVKNGDAYALATNDADALLFQSPRIVRNLNMAGKKKKTNALSFEIIKPDIIDLEENLKHLGISQDQLIVLAMLIGTDYNSGGIKGIGPKTALKLVKHHGHDFDELFIEAKWSEHFEFPWHDVFDIIKNVPVDKSYSMKWQPIDEGKIKEILMGHDFTQERINSQLSNLVKSKGKTGQKGLGDFFG